MVRNWILITVEVINETTTSEIISADSSTNNLKQDQDKIT